MTHDPVAAHRLIHRVSLTAATTPNKQPAIMDVAGDEVREAHYVHIVVRVTFVTAPGLFGRGVQK